MMPLCPKCESSMFQITKKKPSGSEEQFRFIHCNACGYIVGTHENYSISTLLYKLADKLKIKLD